MKRSRGNAADVVDVVSKADAQVNDVEVTVPVQPMGALGGSSEEGGNAFSFKCTESPQHAVSIHRAVSLGAGINFRSAEIYHQIGRALVG